MARATTTAVQQPMAWTKRAAISQSRLGARAQASSGHEIQGETADQHRAPAVAVGHRAADELRGAEAEDEQRQGLLHRRRGDGEIQRHAGQRGKVKVG